MQLKSLVALLLASLVAGESLTYDPTFDEADNSLSTVACSNGPHGLLTRGYTTFGSLPNFPCIGASDAIEGWNSANCGSCWQLTYTPPVESGAKLRSIYMLVIDKTSSGYNTGVTAMNNLTNGHAKELGRVEVTATKVDPAKCMMT